MGKNFRQIVGTLLLTGLLGGGSVLAHHSVRANFDSTKRVTITGTLTEANFRNPHSKLFLRVESPDGTEVDWIIEWADRNALVRRNVGIDRFVVGEVFTISGIANRRIENMIFMTHAILPDGSSLRDCGAPSLQDSEDIYDDCVANEGIQ